MNIELASVSPATSDAALWAVVIDDPANLPSGVAAIDELTGNAASRELQRQRIRTGKGDLAAIPGGDTGPAAFLLTGTPGNDDGLNDAYRTAGARIAATSRARRAHDVVVDVTGLEPSHAGQLIEGLLIGGYRYDRFKSSSAEASDELGEESGEPVRTCTVTGASDAAADQIRAFAALGESVNFARDLANCPGNHLTPALLADEAVALAAQYPDLSVTVLGDKEIANNKMGLIQAVAKGSVNEARVIVLEWNPKGVTTADEDRLAFVGKAVTFDTGGISIKPSAGMQDMRMDKGGGCAVLGGMRAIAELNVQTRVLAVIACAENMPGGNAYKPGDVFTAMDGTTVEVTNTDAEGRLILADAITYARKLSCSHIVEASTLTGAMVIALGPFFAGMIARQVGWTDEVAAAAKASGDHVWHLPMHDAYKPNLKSNCADLVNSGGRAGGSLYAGLFLEHFAKDTPFVHLDIAGTGMLDKPHAFWGTKGASGWGVRLFAQIASGRAQS